MKDVYIFNSLSNKIEKFVPITPNEIKMYVCGPTVYSDAHIGNMRPAVFFDSVVRFFSYLGYKVYYVSNYTDVDDKIIKNALEIGVDEKTLTKKNIYEYEKLLSTLRILPAYAHPRATEYIDKIISYIQDMVDSKSAYVIDGDVFFRISSIDDYGLLSNINIDDLKVGARIDENSKKESPLDFVLWKKTDVGIAWDSPWSKGRPGWHSECSVMIRSLLGNLIDIHGGGFDLKFPHHENEIAQSKAHDHTTLARYWVHNGFVNFGDEKMSKSVGNLILAKDALATYGPDAIRYLLLSSHYRSPVSFTEVAILSAKKETERIINSYKKAAVTIALNYGKLNVEHSALIEPFLDYLCQDFNFSNGITYLNSQIKEINNLLRAKPIDINRLACVTSCVKDMLYILGLDDKYPSISEEDHNLYKRYQEYRQKGQYELSDELRPILIEKHLL